MNPSKKVVALWPCQSIPLWGSCYDSKFMQTQNSELTQTVTKCMYWIFFDLIPHNLILLVVTEESVRTLVCKWVNDAKLLPDLSWEMSVW